MRSHMHELWEDLELSPLYPEPDLDKVLNRVMEQMETEVSNYVHSCCRTNLKNIQETVSYIYRQMVLAAEELQVERSVPRDAGTDEEEAGIKETEWLLGQCLELKRAILE